MQTSNSSVSIALYRALLRKTRHFDKHPALKTFFVWPKELNRTGGFYQPYSFTEELKKRFRRSIPANRLDDEIDKGFLALRWINSVSANLEARSGIQKFTGATENRTFALANPKWNGVVAKPLVVNPHKLKEPLRLLEEGQAQGTYLISHPFLTERAFNRTIILLCEHNEITGSTGLILNKPIPNSTTRELMKEKEVLRQMPANITVDLLLDGKFCDGGPVKMPLPDPDYHWIAAIQALHNIPDIQGAMRVGEGMYWGGETEQIMSSIHKNPSQHLRFYFGSASWKPGQLDHELRSGNWFVAKGPSALAFEHQFYGTEFTRTREERIHLERFTNVKAWEDMLKLMGGEYAHFSALPADISIERLLLPQDSIQGL